MENGKRRANHIVNNPVEFGKGLVGLGDSEAAKDGAQFGENLEVVTNLTSRGRGGNGARFTEVGLNGPALATPNGIRLQPGVISQTKLPAAVFNDSSSAERSQREVSNEDKYENPGTHDPSNSGPNRWYLPETTLRKMGSLEELPSNGAMSMPGKLRTFLEIPQRQGDWNSRTES